MIIAVSGAAKLFLIQRGEEPSRLPLRLPFTLYFFQAPCLKIRERESELWNHRLKGRAPPPQPHAHPRYPLP